MSVFQAFDLFPLAFVHKRLIAGAAGLLSGGPVAAVGGFVSGGGGRAPRLPDLRQTNVDDAQFMQMVNTMSWRDIASSLGKSIPGLQARREAIVGGGGGGGGGCPGIAIRGPAGTCIDPTAMLPGGRPMITQQLAGGGEAVMGRYGAALVPGSRVVDRAQCLPGMHLGNDGLCYNKGAISNKERAWPRGRRPLLTGGDMRAISVASRAANRLTATAVRLQDMGLIKKPVARKKPRKKA